MDNASSMSADVVSLCAYTKINLHLKVLAKRDDGFHDLESIFQRISLADFLSVTKHDDSQCGCIVESPLMVLPAVNTITQAWDVFKAAAGVKYGIRVRVLKHIPAGSGLGAGSSDAASLLRAVNELFDVRLDKAELSRLALRVGSDVPFFLTDDDVSIVSGRGELFTPLTARSDCFGILIWPEVQSSTQDAYRALDKTVSEQTVPFGIKKLCNSYYSTFTEWCFVNDFQPVLEVLYPVIAEACSDLYQQGAAFAQMSGAGSAVFGLFESNEAAAAACNMLGQKWRWCKPFILLA